MSDRNYILALDQGTTSSKAILFDHLGNVASRNSIEFKQIYPKPGWVEHNPQEIWNSQLEAARSTVKQAGIEPSSIAAIGITNQRETTIVWDKDTGKPVYNAIVWQCRRTADMCNDLKLDGWEKKIKKKTGLVVDAYFSSTKVRWILKNVPGAEDRARRGDLLFGTVDTWLIWNLTGGKIHATDYSNASRTMLYNINSLCWDDEILERLEIPKQILSDVRPSSGDFGVTKKDLFGISIPILGVAGDQQAALFGQCCFSKGMAKNTYGTGSFILMNTGENAAQSQSGLLTTIAWGLGNKVYYALEGSTFIAGAVIQWLRDELGIIETAAESEEAALRVPDTGGVYLVPAFVGLGAPHWDMYARGTIVGITRGTNRNHIVRAALEAIAYQTRDLIDAMLTDAQTELTGLRVDGGATTNNFLMQFQADILGINVDRPVIVETTALGAAYLSGLGSGFFKDTKHIEESWHLDKRFKPQMESQKSESLYQFWKKAVDRSKDWVNTQ